jgi:hypothetical protein
MPVFDSFCSEIAIIGSAEKHLLSLPFSPPKVAQSAMEIEQYLTILNDFTSDHFTNLLRAREDSLIKEIFFSHPTSFVRKSHLLLPSLSSSFSSLSMEQNQPIADTQNLNRGRGHEEEKCKAISLTEEESFEERGGMWKRWWGIS